MQPCADHAHGFQHGRFLAVGHVRITGVGAEAHGDRFDVAADLAVKRLSGFCQVLGGRVFHQRRAALVEAGCYFRAIDQFVLHDALTIRQHPLRLAEVRIAHVTFSRGAGRDDVALLATLDQRPVDGRTFGLISQVLELNQLVGQLQRRVSSRLRCGTGVGGFAFDVDEHAIDAIGGDCHSVLVRRLIGENVVMLARQVGDDFFRACRAHFLIRVEQHRDCAEVLELLILQQLE